MRMNDECSNASKKSIYAIDNFVYNRVIEVEIVVGKFSSDVTISVTKALQKLHKESTALGTR